MTEVARKDKGRDCASPSCRNVTKVSRALLRASRSYRSFVCSHSNKPAGSSLGVDKTEGRHEVKEQVLDKSTKPVDENYNGVRKT